MKKFILYSLFFILSLPAFAATEIRDTEIESAISEWVLPLRKNAKIRILNDPSFNAFVRGGDDIFINTGLITQIDNPAELQAVLAHEIGHTELGHLAQIGSKIKMEMTRAILVQTLGIALIALNPNAAIGVMAGGAGIAQQSLLSFTRDEERAADDYAVRALKKAGINQSALLTVFQKMQNPRENKVNPNNINHPLTEERIKNIRLAIGENSESRIQNSELNKLKLIQAKLIGYLGTAAQVETLYPATDKSQAAIYARAIAAMRAGNLQAAEAEARKLGDGAYFNELLGDIEFQLGNYDASVAAYEKSLAELNIKNKTQIEAALALVLSERKKDGDILRAGNLARRAILTEPAPLPYWVLAKTDAENSDYWLAGYHYVSGERKKAKKYAKQAMKKLSPDSPEYIKAQDISESKE